MAAAADGCDAARDVIAMSRHFHKVVSGETPPGVVEQVGEPVPEGAYFSVMGVRATSEDLKKAEVTMVPVVTPVTDPQLVWANLIRTPQGRSLTDPRIQQLSPQRFDTVFLSALKSAFLAGWDASKEGGEG